eukprot:360194-Chlamydomonas_euryale.AAC.11
MVQHTACSVYELLAGTGVVLLKLPHGQCTAMLLLPSPPPTKHPHTLQLDAVPCSFEGIQSWAHIKEHADRRARGSGRSAVEIDHVANLHAHASKHACPPSSGQSCKHERNEQDNIPTPGTHGRPANTTNISKGCRLGL